MRFKYNPFTDNLDLVPQSTASDGYIIYVASLADLPAPVAGKITINTGRMYYFVKPVDFGGLQLDVLSCVLQGTSQEFSGIQNATIRVLDTCTMRDFRFDSCSMLIDSATGAFDWSHINFYDCSDIEIRNADNVVLDTFGFINSHNVRITGTLNSFILAPNCIFRSVTNTTATFFKVASTAIINRRIRCQDSVFQTSFATQTAIAFEAGAVIGIESFIFKTVRITGPGIAISGINGNDDRAFFFEVVGTGIVNTTAGCNLYMKNNTVPTPVVINLRYAMLGPTQFGPIFQKFIHIPAENSVQYTSVVSRLFSIRAVFTIISGANNIVGVYIGICRAGNAINPDNDRITESEIYSTTSGARPESSGVQCLAQLNQGDRVYCILQNKSASGNVTIEFFNLIIEKLAT